MKHKVKIMVTGQRPREVYFLPGETLSDLCRRLHSPSWPLVDVDNWYCNGKTPDVSPRKTTLQDGFTYAGTPRVGGARAITLKLYGWDGFLKFQKGDTLHEAVMSAPLDVRAAAAAHTPIYWKLWGPGQDVSRRISYFTSFKLQQGMTVEALYVRASLAGHGGSIAFPIVKGETFERFLGRGTKAFPMWEAQRFFTIGAGGERSEVHNPGHFELKPGMSLLLE